MVLTKSKGPKVPTAERPDPFLLFISHLGEESKKRARFWSYSAPGVGDLWAQDRSRCPIRSPDLILFHAFLIISQFHLKKRTNAED